jgi:hypothetical protein
MPTHEENERTFEKMGFARVKSLALNNGLPPNQLGDAVRWVAKWEEKERLRQLEDHQREREERQRDQERQVSFEADTRRLGRSTRIAAWIAALGTIVSIIVALLTYLLPRT